VLGLLLGEGLLLVFCVVLSAECMRVYRCATLV
jgi:hypothetical protein